MASDIVELIERVEHEFGVQIPNDVAATLETPRMVLDHLMTYPSVSNGSSRETVALELWFVIEDQLGIDRYLFTKDSRFVSDFRID